MKTKYQIRSKQVRWRATFKTLKEAKAHVKKDWGFKDDSTVYIVKIMENQVCIKV